MPSAPEFVGGTERGYLMVVPAEECIFYRPGVKLKIKLLPDSAGTFYLYEPAKLSERLKHKYRIHRVVCFPAETMESPGAGKILSLEDGWPRRNRSPD